MNQVEQADRAPEDLISRDKTTLEQLFDMLLTHCRVNGRKSAWRVPFALKHLQRARLGERLAVTLDVMTEYQRARLDEDHAKPTTINYETRMLCLAVLLAFDSGKVASVLKVSELEENNV